MAVDKLVDSAQLDADLTSVANAIRTKGGTTAQMAFPSGFVSAVHAIPTGITPTGTKQISITQNGVTTEDVTQYADAEITVNVSGGGGYTVNDILSKNITEQNVVWNGTGTLIRSTLSEYSIETIQFTNIATISSCPSFCYRISNLKSFSAPNLTSLTSSTYFLAECANLETINMPKLQSLSGCDNFANRCTKLANVHLDACTNMGGGTFYGCTSLVTIVLPKSTTFYSNNFYGCTNLQTADILANDRINAGTFGNCSSLNTLIIRRSANICPLGNINAFAGSPFANGGAGGDIYVPSALISAYQSATNWSTINGYGTITWHAIEGSYYETHYADGTVIS